MLLFTVLFWSIRSSLLEVHPYAANVCNGLLELYSLTYIPSSSSSSSSVVVVVVVIVWKPRLSSYHLNSMSSLCSVCAVLLSRSVAKTTCAEEIQLSFFIFNKSTTDISYHKLSVSVQRSKHSHYSSVVTGEFIDRSCACHVCEFLCSLQVTCCRS